MGFETAVQEVIYSTLSADEALTSKVEGIFDAVPQLSRECGKVQQQKFPYVTIGEAIHNAWDTDNTLGNDVSIVIHTWSRARGRQETKEIQGIIYAALNRKKLAYTGYDIITIDFESSQTFTDADGLTRHGVQSFRILIDEV